MSAFFSGDISGCCSKDLPLFWPICQIEFLAELLLAKVLVWNVMILIELFSKVVVKKVLIQLWLKIMLSLDPYKSIAF